MTKDEIEQRANEIRDYNLRQEEMRRELLDNQASIRDQFAMSVVGHLLNIIPDKTNFAAARAAYEIADAMLAERDKNL